MLLSIDVGSGKFYAAEGSCNAGIVNVIKTGELSYPKDTIEDGVLKNKASFISSLEKLVELKNFKTSASSFTINSSTILSRRLDLPLSKPRDMAKMVKSEMYQIVKETNDYIFEYSIVNDTQPDKKVKSVWAYAIPKEIVDEYYAVFKLIRLRPSAMDIHANSAEKLFLNAVVNGRQKIGGNAALLVCIEEEDMEVHLFSDGQRAFSRVVSVSASELRAMAQNAGLMDPSGDFDQLDITGERFASDPILGDYAKRYIGGLTEELQKMIQFQKRRNASDPVGMVYLYGSMACVKGLAEGVGAALGIHTENIVSLSNVVTNEPKLVKYINAIGSLIRL